MVLLELHAPQCPTHNDGRCRCDRIDDAYSFCRSLVNDYLAVGARRGDGSFTGPSPLSFTQTEDLVQDMVLVAWRAAGRFNGNGRLSGWVVYKVTKGITDWKRHEFGSTRYGPRPILESTDDKAHLGEQFGVLADLSGPEVVELAASVSLSPNHQQTLRDVLMPIVFGGSSVEEYAARSGKPLSQVQREIGSLRRELERKELLAA